jgi:hypothetical protein
VPGGFGLRVAVLAAALIAVAVVSVVAEWSTTTILGVMFGAWLVVSAIELTTSRVEARPARDEEEPEPPAVPAEEPSPHVRVLEPPLEVADSDEDSVQVSAARAEAEREAERQPEQVPPQPLPEPEAEAAREPEPVRPPLLAVPAARLGRRVREPDRSPEPEPAPTVVPLAAYDERPRQWNLWDLERASRDVVGTDPLLDEERSYLLMYLREFANPNGSLPEDFDALVRDSFGDVIAAMR